jgi:hypothetical protein
MVMDNKVICKVTLSFTPYPLFQWYSQSNEILLNLRMRCWNSVFNAGSRVNYSNCTGQKQESWDWEGEALIIHNLLTFSLKLIIVIVKMAMIFGVWPQQCNYFGKKFEEEAIGERTSVPLISFSSFLCGNHLY